MEPCLLVFRGLTGRLGRPGGLFHDSDHYFVRAPVQDRLQVL